MRTLQVLALVVAVAFVVSSLVAQTTGPNTIEEAFQELDRRLPTDQKEAFKHKRELEAVLDAHFGLGMGIRNEWFRSGRSALPGYLRSLGVRGLDDMSSVVVGAYWRYLNGRPIEIQSYIEKQRSCFARLYEEQKLLLAEAKDKPQRGQPSYDCP
jgi:hypothetical protein